MMENAREEEDVETKDVLINVHTQTVEVKFVKWEPVNNANKTPTAKLALPAKIKNVLINVHL
jgi:hypothetical protein